MLAPASLLLLLTLAAADEAVDAVDHGDGHAFSFAAVPTLTFNTDEGFGTGGVGTLYHRHAGVEPYRDALTLNVFVSTKLVQAHALTWDALKPFDVDGRMYLRLGYYSTVSQNYCGVGNDVACSAGEAARAADRLGLDDADGDADGDTARADFVRHYYLMRFVRPYATAIVRPWLRDKPWRVEGLLGWRGSVLLPGELGFAQAGGDGVLGLQWREGPYPDSRYAQDFPRGEAGVSSAPFAGVIVDDRDSEFFPTRGLYAEASVRGAHPWLGSTWSYLGGDVQLAGFFALARDPRVVVAARVIGDGLLGDPSIEELARIGGTVDSIAFGGSSIGRGIREHRYLGKLKLISQVELRAQLVDVQVLGETFNLGAALFSDVAWIGYDVAELRGRPLKLLSTVGVSWRILWNEAFPIRWDLAVSPDEAEGPGFYIIVGQAF